MKTLFYFYDIVHGGWGKWGNFTECDKSCGEGTHTRTRECNKPSVRHGGKDCKDKMNPMYDGTTETDTKPCNEKDCPTSKPNFRLIRL